MLTIQRLQLTNWCQHVKLDKTFGATTTGIIGRNGAGKSNTVGALHFALRGTPLSNAALEDCINFGADSAEVKLWFSAGSVEGTITRTLTAARHENGAREACKSTAKLVFGDETVTGVKKVQERMVDLLGVKGEVLSEHVFISQDALNALLFSTPADRVNGMIMLMPEIGKAEWLRGELAKELAIYPELVLTTPLAAIQDQVDLAAAQVEDAHANLVLAEEELKEAEPLQASAQDALAKHAAAQGALDRVVGLKRELDALADPTNIEQRYAQVASEVEQLSVALPAMDAAYKAADKALHAHNGQLFARDRLATLQKIQSDTQTRLAGMGPAPAAPPAVNLAELDQLIASSAGEAQQIRKWLDKCLAGVSVCPTCGQAIPPVPEERKAAETARMNGLNAAIAQATAARKAAQDALVAYTREAAVYASAKQSAESTLAQTEAEIRSLKLDMAAILTDEQVKQCQDVIAAYGVASNKLREQSTLAAQLQASLSTTTAKRSRLEAQILSCEEQLKDLLAENAEAACRATIVRANEARTGVAKWRATKEMAAKTLEGNRAALEQAIKLSEKVTVRKAYRARLEEARNLLHRDNLPTKLLAQKAVALRDSCNRFLQMFGSPFALNVFADMSMTCTLASGYEVPIQMLSGGQRSVLSVCMRFAINELFSRHLGLLVLDEPSASMDRDNVMSMRRLFEQVHSVSLKTGVQTVVITHHAELLGAFDAVIEI